jgi:ribosomal small subunit protein bTHX
MAEAEAEAEAEAVSGAGEGAGLWQGGSMGKGDRRTGKGKRFRGSHGVTRPKGKKGKVKVGK